MREGAACEAARHAPWAGRGYSAGCGQMHRSVGRGVPGISATAPITIGEGSITGGWGGDFEIDYWSLLPRQVICLVHVCNPTGAMQPGAQLLGVWILELRESGWPDVCVCEWIYFSLRHRTD